LTSQFSLLPCLLQKLHFNLNNFCKQSVPFNRGNTLVQTLLGSIQLARLHLPLGVKNSATRRFTWAQVYLPKADGTLLMPSFAPPQPASSYVERFRSLACLPVVGGSQASLVNLQQLSTKTFFIPAF
jgi:hypothetical protein